MNYLNGMPCHKYIIRKLAIDSDILEFERAFIDMLTGADISDGEIVTALTLMEQHILPDGPIAGKHFDIDGNVNMGDFINNIRFDNEIPTHKNCRAYYRKYDKHYTACKACSYSSINKNGNIDNEHKIIRFIVSSKENLLYVKDKIKASDFESVYDILEYAIVQRPLFFPFYRNTCEFYFSKERDDTDFSDQEIPETLLDDLISKLKLQRPPKEFMTEGWDERYGGYLSDILYEIPCPTKKQVDVAIANFYAFKKKEKSRKKKDDIASSTKKEAHIYQPTIESIVFPEKKIEKKDEEKSNAEDSEQIKEVINEQKERSRSKEEQKSNESGEKDTKERDAAAKADNIEIIDDIDSAGEYITIESESDIPEYAEPDGNKTPYHPTVFVDEMEASAINLDKCSALTAAAFEKTVCSDGRVCVECVFTETEDLYLLFYVRGLRKFFYTSMSAEQSSGYDAAIAVLKRDGIEKICYSPLMLYAFVRHTKGFLRNLYSIESAAALLEENCSNGLLVYAEEAKARRAVSGEDFDSEYEVISPVFSYMPAYYWIKVTQSKKIQKKDCKYQEIQLKLFDEAVGSGYLMASYLYSEGYSLQILNPGVYRFRKEYVQKPRENGKFIKYELCSEIANKIHLLRKVCCNLAEKGVLRRRAIYLMQIYQNGINFFVEEQDAAFAITIISVEFLNVFGENKAKHIELQTAYVTKEKIKGTATSLLSLEDRNRAKQMRIYKEQMMKKMNTAQADD